MSMKNNLDHHRRGLFAGYTVAASALAAALPLLLFIEWFLLIVLVYSGFLITTALLVIIFALGALPAIGLSGWWLATRFRLPGTLFARYAPFFGLICLLLLLLALDFLLIPETALFATAPIFHSTPDELLLYVQIAAAIVVMLALSFALASHGHPVSEKLKGVIIIGFSLLVCASLPGLVLTLRTPDIIDTRESEPVLPFGIDVNDYLPFRDSSRLAMPPSPPERWIDVAHPRLDGAYALLPLYGALAQSLYRGIDSATPSPVVQCNGTSAAFDRLAKGKTDVFFGLAPSGLKSDGTAAQDDAFHMTPVGYDALVFFVNRSNPIRNLTSGQLRAIYDRKVSNWRTLGGPDMPILAFRQPAHSDIQAAMEHFIQPRKIASPLYERIDITRKETILGVAPYRNRPNAIGYSFRWYVTEQYSDPDIRLLSIDGIAPTPENIANKSYPLVVPLLAVTARSPSPESRQLIDWIAGPEGQALVERVGYIPLGS